MKLYLVRAMWGDDWSIELATFDREEASDTAGDIEAGTTDVPVELVEGEFTPEKVVPIC